MSVLKALGLMRVSEHREIVERFSDGNLEVAGIVHGLRVELEEERERCNRAVTDLAAQAERAELWLARAEDYRPDAEAMRAKRKRDRDMKAAKRGNL